jgi:hypothetical protein
VTRGSGYPARHRRRGRLAVLSIVVAVALAAGACGDDGGTDPDGATSTTAGGESPTAVPDLGDDPELDALAQDCSDGDMEACDLLGLSGPPRSAYEDYGSTCGGRNETLVGELNMFCIDLYPGEVPPGSYGDS